MRARRQTGPTGRMRVSTPALVCFATSHSGTSATLQATPQRPAGLLYSRPKPTPASVSHQICGGGDHTRLLTHVNNCFREHVSCSDRYVVPVLEILGSHGCGKSRVLYQLAATYGKEWLRVVYWYNPSTVFLSRDRGTAPSLSTFLFPARKVEASKSVNALMRRLITLFSAAVSLDLWEATARELFHGMDWVFALTLETHDIRDKIAADAEERIVVLAIDNVPTLASVNAIAMLSYLYTAAHFASQEIKTRFGPNPVLLLTVAHADPSILAVGMLPLAPPNDSKPNQRRHRPFLPNRLSLLDTDDEATTEVELYQNAVLASIGFADSSSTLSVMGRPLWKHAIEVSGRTSKRSLMLYAARRLVGVSDASKITLNEGNLYGVASILCRVGLRPRVTSKLAYQTVRDMMATLLEVGHDRNKLICTYAEDPMMALGSTCLWHVCVANTMRPHRHFTESMLPQFRKLLMDNAVVFGGDIELVVVCILLVLAMDACGELESGVASARWTRAGEFHSAWTLLRALHGDTPSAMCVRSRRPAAQASMLETTAAAALGSLSRKRVRGEITADDEERDEEVDDHADDVVHVLQCDQPLTTVALRELKSRMSKSLVSSTHVVELLEEPSETVLWRLLSRRAAGTLPQTSRGLALVIPVLMDPSIPDSVDTVGGVWVRACLGDPCPCRPLWVASIVLLVGDD